MLEDDIKKFLENIAPPAALSTALTMLILRVHNQTQLDWPILGEFIMDDALKAVMIAIVWFILFAGWALLKTISPRLRYSKEVVEATISAREYLSTADSKNLRIQFTGMTENQKKIYALDQVENNSKISANLQSEKVRVLFLKACKSKLNSPSEYDAHFTEFNKKTNWVRWK